MQTYDGRLLLYGNVLDPLVEHAMEPRHAFLGTTSNRKMTQLVFRIFFASCFVGSVGELVRELRAHPVTSRNVLPTLATASIMLGVAGH